MYCYVVRTCEMVYELLYHIGRSCDPSPVALLYLAKTYVKSIYCWCLPLFYLTRRYCIDKLGFFHASLTATCLDPHEGCGWYRETSLSPPVIFLLTNYGGVSFVGLFCYLCLSLPYCGVCVLQPYGNLFGIG